MTLEYIASLKSQADHYYKKIQQEEQQHLQKMFGYIRDEKQFLISNHMYTQTEKDFLEQQRQEFINQSEERLKNAREFFQNIINGKGRENTTFN